MCPAAFTSLYQSSLTLVAMIQISDLQKRQPVLRPGKIASPPLAVCVCGARSELWCFCKQSCAALIHTALTALLACLCLATACCFHDLFWCLLEVIWASLVAQTVKRLPAMRETQVRFLGREDPLEKEMAANSITIAWKIPWTEEPDRLQSMGRIESDTTERLTWLQKSSWILAFLLPWVWSRTKPCLAFFPLLNWLFSTCPFCCIATILCRPLTFLKKLIYFGHSPCMWDISSPARDWTRKPCTGSAEY